MPPALAMGAVGLLTGTAVRNSAAGYLLPLAWWQFDWTTGGFCLMATNRSWLLGLAGAAWLLTWAALCRRDR